MTTMDKSLADHRSSNILFVDKSCKNAILPVRSDDHSERFDLFTPRDISIRPGETKLVDTGIRLILKMDHFYVKKYNEYNNNEDNWNYDHFPQIFDKSSVVSSKKCRIVGSISSPGIDSSGFRGSMKVFLFNFSEDIAEFKKGDPIAQVVFFSATVPEIVKFVREFATDDDDDDSDDGYDDYAPVEVKKTLDDYNLIREYGWWYI